MTRAIAAAVLVAVLAAPAVATPRTVALDGAGARAFVRADAGAPLAAVMLFVRAGLDRQTPAQSGLAALVAEAILHVPAGTATGGNRPPALEDAVDDVGASITVAVDPQGVHVLLEGTPEGLAAAAPLVAGVLAAPAFDAVTLDAARASLAEQRVTESADPRAVGRTMLRSSYYRGGAALPALGDAARVANVAPADAAAFYRTWYVRGDAVAAAAGRTDEGTAAAERALLAALPAGTARATPLVARALGVQPKRIVTHRDVGVPYVVLGFAAPPLGDRDFPAALVLRAVLDSIFAGPAAATQPTLFRATGVMYGYDTTPAQLLLWVNGARVEPDVALSSLAAVAKAAAAKPLTAAVLARYKETARGAWALEGAPLDRQAAAIADAVAHGLPPDAADAAGAAIARVTAADVQRVAKKYFQRFDVALVIPRESGN